MKSNELRNLIRQEVKSLLKENITPDSSPQEILDYANDLRTKLAAKIDDGMKAVRLQLKRKKDDWVSGRQKSYMINGQEIETMPGEEIQLFKVNFPKVKLMMQAYREIPGYVNAMFYFMEKGNLARAEEQYRKLMTMVKKHGL